MKKHYIKRYSVPVVSIVGLLIFICISCSNMNPNYVLNKYIKSINDKNYKLSHQLINKEYAIKQYEDDTIIEFLRTYLSEIKLVNMEKLKQTPIKHTENGKHMNTYNVRYNTESKASDQKITLIQVGKKWQVIFPFKISNVEIISPLGSEIFINNEPLEHTKSPVVQLSNLLPGQYKMEMRFMNDQQPYTKNIRVPIDKTVTIPYEMMTVTIETPPQMIIGLGDYQWFSESGKLVLNNMIEGNYKLKMIDPYGQLETIEKDIQVTKDQKEFVIKEIKLSNKGEENIEKYINEFYDAYEKGIIKGNNKFLKKYVVAEKQADIMKTYSEWFIDNKKTKEVKFQCEIEKASRNNNGYLTIPTLEVIEMMIEDDENNFNKFKIVIQSEIILEPVGDTYLIQDKVIKQSVVSYLSEDNIWTNY
ncbi:MAG: hypothetical protein ACRCSG_05710 [Cellulosilyticaceae bacterium]